MRLADDGRAADAVGFVLAGGRSSRMGEDKALVSLAGRPLIAHAVDILHRAGLAAHIAGARSPLGAFAPVVEDMEADRGPLGGICAALASTAARWSVFLPVDLPLMPPLLLGYLLNHARIVEAAVTLPAVNEFAQTFPAVVDRAALPIFEGELKAGRGGCFAAFKAAAGRLGGLSQVAVESLVQCGQVAHSGDMPPIWWFLNVNAAGDLKKAETYLAGPHRVI